MKAKYVRIGKNVKKYRAIAEWKQAELAEKTGFTTSHIGQIETASGIPSVEALIKIADALGVTMDEICYGSVKNSAGYLADEFNRLTEGMDIHQKRCAIDMAVAVWEHLCKFNK